MDKNEIAFNNKKLFNIQVPSNLYTGSLNDNCKYISKTNSKILHMKDDYCGIKFIFFWGGGGQYSYSFKKKNMVQRDAIIGGISICIYKCLYQSLELIWIFEYMYLVQKKSTNSKLPRLYTVLLFYQVIIFKTIWISIFFVSFQGEEL